MSAPEELDARFRAFLDQEVRAPLVGCIEACGEALREATEAMAGLADANGDGAADANGAADAAARVEYADRFARAFRPDLLEAAGHHRETFLRRLNKLPELAADLPETVRTDAADSTAAMADPLVRPRLARRLMDRIRRPAERTIPVQDLARVYQVELARRLEPAADHAARLDSVALALIRAQLASNNDPAETPSILDALDEAIARVVAEVDGSVLDIGDAFSRALLAPSIRVDVAEASELRARIERARERRLARWRAFADALRANTVAEAELARALAALDLSAGTVTARMADALEAHGRQPLDRLAEGLRSLARRSEEELRATASADTIEALRADAAARFDAELPAVSGGLRQSLEEAAAHFIEALAEIPGSVPDHLRISERRIHTIPEEPDELELRSAPLRELLGTACRGALPRTVERELAVAVEELGALRQELHRVRKAVDFHLRAPLRGGFRPGEAAELVVDSMERAASQLEDFRDTAVEAVERMVARLDRQATEEADVIRSAVAEREFLRIRSEIAEEQAVRQVATGVEWARRLTEVGLRIARRGWSAGRGTFDRTQDWAERQLGVAEVARERMLESLEESLLDGRDRRVAVPGLYRQLFDVEGEVPWEELLVDRRAELGTLERAVDRWRRGQSAAVAVIGEKGSGKTTLLRMAADLLGDRPAHTIRLGATLSEPAELVSRLAAGLDKGERTPPATIAQLSAALRARGPSVVFLEDAHHLFIRALGGFAAMESFLELLAATRPEVLWVVTMDEYAWRYLDHVLGFGPHFSHVVSTTNFSAEQLERAVMARHQVSGFGLQFELDERHTPARRWWHRFRRREPGGELSRRELERRAYFRELTQIAEGNIFLALFYWLRSVDRVEEHELVLRAPEMIDLDFLERLPLPSLHTIAAIILHGGLSEEEHRRIFHLGPSESRLHIAGLTDAHLIFRSDDGEYRINKVLYRPLIRLLRARNIV